jgi:hypothetical protein
MELHMKVMKGMKLGEVPVPVRLCLCPSVSLSLSVFVYVRLCPCPYPSLSMSVCVPFPVRLCLCPSVSLSLLAYVPVHCVPVSFRVRPCPSPFRPCPCNFAPLFLSLAVSMSLSLSMCEFCHAYFNGLLWLLTTVNFYLWPEKSTDNSQNYFSRRPPTFCIYILYNPKMTGDG